MAGYWFDFCCDPQKRSPNELLPKCSEFSRGTKEPNEAAASSCAADPNVAPCRAESNKDRNGAAPVVFAHFRRDSISRVRCASHHCRCGALAVLSGPDLLAGAAVGRKTCSRITSARVPITTRLCATRSCSRAAWCWTSAPAPGYLPSSRPERAPGKCTPSKRRRSRCVLGPLRPETRSVP